MSHHVQTHTSKHGSVKQYVFGFLMSLILTLVPLVAVLNHVFSTVGNIVLIVATAIIQMCIQLFFFMHVTDKPDEGPAWHGITLILGFVIVFTIVAGSIWVMSFSSQVQ